MVEKNKHGVEELIASIHAHGTSLEAIAERLRTPEIQGAFNKWDPNSWCRSVAGDSLVRIGLFTEQNFNFVETMGVIAVARYIFELSVWLYLFKLDQRYGLVYFSQLLDTQRRYFQDVKAQLKREIALLKSFGDREKESLKEKLEIIKGISSVDEEQQAILSKLNSFSEAIDGEARRQFSIYAKDAQTNGYEFQAYLVETKAVPRVEQALRDITLEISNFESNVSQDVKDLIPHRWDWRQMAQRVGLTDEYDYIYRFASKLLHATPASITTDQKNLELSEIEVFLKYIDVKIVDVMTLGGAYC